MISIKLYCNESSEMAKLGRCLITEDNHDSTSGEFFFDIGTTLRDGVKLYEALPNYPIDYRDSFDDLHDNIANPIKRMLEVFFEE